MNALHRTRPGIGSLVVLGFLVFGAARAVANQDPSTALEEVAATESPTVAPQQPNEAVPPSPEAVLNEDTADFEELLRGPLHEAFAEQYSPQPIEGAIADRQPPPPVPEMPPEIRPDGKNVEWLPGYWFWDDDRDDFIWISGTWRVVPPGVRWMPGYWIDLGDGRHQWVAGTWVGSAQNQLEYIAEAPPATLDLGPVGDAPSANHFWVPGCWQWNNSAYAWRPGYWSVGYANWVWVPSRYLWTPRGHVYCAGYWDYPFDARGTLFAPIWFNRPIYAAPGFFFSPRAALLATVLRTHLWVRPGFRHYYFGDFYALNYRQRGIYPWFGYHTGLNLVGGRRGYDPLFEHYSRFHGGGGAPLIVQMNNQFNQFVNQPSLRPPRTFTEQGSWRGMSGGPGAAAAESARGTGQLAAPLSELARRDSSRYRTLPSDQVAQLRARSEQFPELASMRRNLESAAPRASQKVESLPIPTSSRSRSTTGRLADSSGSGGSPGSGQRLQANPASAARNALQNPLQSDSPALSRSGAAARSASSQSNASTQQLQQLRSQLEEGRRLSARSSTLPDVGSNPSNPLNRTAGPTARAIPDSQRLGGSNLPDSSSSSATRRSGSSPAAALRGLSEGTSAPQRSLSNPPSSLPRSALNIPSGSNPGSGGAAQLRSLPGASAGPSRSSLGDPSGTARPSITGSGSIQSSSGAAQRRSLPSASGSSSRSSLGVPSGTVRPSISGSGSIQSSSGAAQLRSLPSASGGPSRSSLGVPRSSSGSSISGSSSLRSSGGGGGFSPSSSSRQSLGTSSSLRSSSGSSGSSGSRNSSGSSGGSSSSSSRSRR